MVTFSPGETSATFSISINDDNTYEWNETFTLYIYDTSSSIVAIGDCNSTKVTIMDNKDSMYLLYVAYSVSRRSRRSMSCMDGRIGRQGGFSPPKFCCHSMIM